jgi:hypothetical protein
LSPIGERARQFGASAARVGMRWQASPAFSVDLSRAVDTGSTLDPSGTLGASSSFAPWPP